MLMPTIHLTFLAHAALKREIGLLLKDVKSSHRAEALARALGYQTNASLLADIKSRDGISVAPCAETFRTYLAQQNYDATTRALALPVTRIGVREVQKRTPMLTASGIGIGDRRRLDDGRRETIEDMRVRFEDERSALLSDRYIEAVLLSMMFLSRVKRTSTIRSMKGSYWIKHVAENYSVRYDDGVDLGPRYVPNGALIAAALLLGFRMKTHVYEDGTHSLNATFNMSWPSLESLDKEIRSERYKPGSQYHNLIGAATSSS